MPLYGESHNYGTILRGLSVLIVGIDQTNGGNSNNELVLLCGQARIDYIAPKYAAKYHNIQDAVNFICQLFEEHGDTGLNNIEGDFAISYWHRTRQEVVCITSVFTVFPLYYYYDAQLFAAANDIDQLFVDVRVPRAPNLHYIANINQRIHRQNQNFETLYEQIYYMPGGQIYRFNLNGITMHKYWQPDIKKRYNYTTEQEWAEEIAKVFSEAVNCRITGDGEQGILLSGGLDSSAMASVAEKILLAQGKQLHAFSHVLPTNYVGKAWDEREYIELFRDKNIEINYLDRISNANLEDLRSVVKDKRITRSLTSFLTQQKLVELVKHKKVTNLLVGTFSELGMSGYGNGYFTELLLTGRWWRLARESKAMARRVKCNWFKLFVSDALRPLIPEALFCVFSRSLRERTSLEEIPFKSEFLAQHKLIAKPKHGKMSSATNHRQYQVDSINRAMKMNIGTILETDGLKRSFPFLDRRVVEICLAAPGWMKVNNGFRRNIIRRSMRGIMPDKVCTRLTKGEATPCYPEQALNYIPEFQQLIAEIPRDSYAAKLIDLDKLSQLCANSSATAEHKDRLSPDNFTMVIPPAISLAYFLNGL